MQRECEVCKALTETDELELIRVMGRWSWACRACRQEQEWPSVRGDRLANRLVAPVRNRLSRPT